MSNDFITMTLTADFGTVSEKMFSTLESQIGYAAKLTVNDLAFDVKRAVDDEMRATFHKPTPFTMSAIRVIKDEESTRLTETVGGITTRPNRTVYTATVGLAQEGMPASSKKSRWSNTVDDAWERALKHQFTGGMRRFKRWEGALLWRKLIPPGYYAVPASGCPMDAYDNPKPGFMVQLLAYFRAFNEVGKGYRSNMNDKGRGKFEKKLEAKMGNALRTGFFISYGQSGKDPGFVKKVKSYQNLPAGIWQRYYGGAWGGFGVQPVFLFYPASSYKRLISFDTIAVSAVQGNIAERFYKNLSRAVRTANR